MYARTTGSPYSPISSFTSAMPLVLAATCWVQEGDGNVAHALDARRTASAMHR